ncbi:uncharacterized protein KZ484_002506 isoform 2-T2 [Pholidichthys leucotaenia]
MDFVKNVLPNFYKHLCFGLGCVTTLYSPFRSLQGPLIFGGVFTIFFEILGIFTDMPAHTKWCKGPPYERADACWGLCFALFVAVLNLNSYHVYTQSYGFGIIVFAIRGAIRKYNFLSKVRKAWRTHR